MSAFSLTPSDFAALCDVIRAVSRSGGLLPEDAEDFSQHVHLRLLERNYAPITMFAGRSSFRTYLFVVVKRMLLDWRNRNGGKWRPSASARRLGDAAVALDRLMSRDGHPLDEAIAILEGGSSSVPAGMLRTVADGLTRRSRRRFVVPEQALPTSIVPFADPIEIREADRARRQALLTLRRAYARLPLDDRRLLYLRFERKMTVAAIAELLDTPAKPLYRRLAGLLRTLRLTMGHLDARAIQGDDSATAQSDDVVVH